MFAKSWQPWRSILTVAIAQLEMMGRKNFLQGTLCQKGNIYFLIRRLFSLVRIPQPRPQLRNVDGESYPFSSLKFHPSRRLSSMYNRPDRPLIVKCTFDRWNKRITFSSARNCTYDLLRHKAILPSHSIISTISNYWCIYRSNNAFHSMLLPTQLPTKTMTGRSPTSQQIQI